MHFLLCKCCLFINPCRAECWFSMKGTHIRNTYVKACYRFILICLYLREHSRVSAASSNLGSLVLAFMLPCFHRPFPCAAAAQPSQGSDVRSRRRPA